jgi:DNA gyrase subunit A
MFDNLIIKNFFKIMTSLNTDDQNQLFVDNIEPRILESEMESSYLKYAMSVIVSRALPDVRDGLKPVHRRIMYVMHRLGLNPGGKYRKSAQVVGEALAKYHPHGDTSVYDALVRQAQDFVMRYPLVDGQGNFGSVDGDSAAAMRYTECKMSKVATNLLSDIDKDTVDFVDNYDGSHLEPKVLPSRIPNLLINGVNGIAVGMATSIPPHNLEEVTQALLYLIKNPEAGVEELCQFIKGPDLPTGGIIYGAKDLVSAYKTGRGKCMLRAKVDIKEDSLIIEEIPFLVNKAVLVEKIADLVKDKKIEGIKDLRDESNKEGIRVVVECKRDVSPEVILNHLYQQTDLEINLHFNSLALVNEGRQPKQLNLLEILIEFLNFRIDVVTRRTKFDLREAEAELHILKGLKIALDSIDEVIKIIRSSDDKNQAAVRLIERFSFTKIQTEAILQMRLQTLTNLDKQKIEAKINDLNTLIAKLTNILENRQVLMELISQELIEVNTKLYSPRKTVIVENSPSDSKTEDFIQEEEVIVQLTNEQYLKVVSSDSFRRQGRGGKGVISFNARENDFVKSSSVASSHDYVYAFTNKGRVFKTRVFDMPTGSRTGRGQNLVNYFELKGDEKITNLLTLSKEIEHKLEGYLVFATVKGIVKKTSVEDYSSVRKTGMIAINLKEGDRLISVQYSGRDDDRIVLSSDNGKTVIFDARELSETGRNSQGVIGMRIPKGHKLIAMQVSSFEFDPDVENDED